MKTKIKNIFSISLTTFLMVFVLTAFTGCDGSASGENYINLASMSNTMAYAQVENMLSKPKTYKGMTVKIKGTCRIENYNSKKYYHVEISDATSCCSKGFEFVLKSGGYPTNGKTVTIEGTFGTYKEGSTTYYRLSSARVV